MLNQMSFKIFMIMILLSFSLNVFAAESFPSSKRYPATNGTNQLKGIQEEMRSVLTVTPREIDLGAIKPGETAFGEFSLKNMTQQSVDWAISCPDGWEAAGGKDLRATVSGEPSYVHMELNVAQRPDTVKDASTKTLFKTSIRLETSGKQFSCQKDLKPGAQRIAFKVSFPGGQRTAYMGFRIFASQETPYIHLNPQRLDLGSQPAGKIISKRIELTNRGREMLRWSVVAKKSRPGELPEELPKERYISFRDDSSPDAGRYVMPDHLKESMELIGRWTERNGYPMTRSGAGSLKLRFNGTGISVFLQSHTEEGNCSIYLDESPVHLPDVLSGVWDKKELVIAEGLPDGPHMISVVIRDGALEIEGVKVFGKEVIRGPKNWITVFPNSGTTTSETDYLNVKVDTSQLAPGYYSDQIVIKSNAGEEKAEIYVDVVSDTSAKMIDVYLYSKDFDYLLTSDPQADSKRLIQHAYIKVGIAFRLFAPATPGTVSFYRWYNPVLRDHFYHYERMGGGKNLSGYVYEGIIGNIATSRLSNTRELYRWYNLSTKKHYYSTNPKTATGAMKSYRFDGIAGYVR